LQPVQVMAPTVLIGEVARVRVVEAGTNSLFGELATPVHKAPTPALRAASGGA
jgi:hypothetical protein